MAEFNPYKEMKKLQRKMNRFDSNNCSAKINLWRPIVNLREQDNNIIITFELPGLNKDNITIECTKDNNIIISGEKRSNPMMHSNSQVNSGASTLLTPLPNATLPKHEPSDVISPTNLNSVSRNIITIGKFIRSYKLPYGTDYTKIKASMEDGILEIIIPKEKVDDKFKVPIQSKL
ncbi:heat shock protein Hsp20 domain-containing protein [Tieghemostelium lacteum]|uniref:Heat shock protein Hsp20 domain-containing protein n=1 Tax=Tieghemostelium lacteum TaxID=361077 RepID=A0A151ZIC8_TIELA|nr:heat shock protein Hsp20 domain-containing protein [Tieghemostelium lacteum]|eukprot:KYQ93667.1 heat shock protein Hsp20 domain-containing protein [Tieghemostelium lacteum]